MEAQTHAQTVVGTLLDPEFQLPARSNSVNQPMGSNLCGFYLLSSVCSRDSLWHTSKVQCAEMGKNTVLKAWLVSLMA